MTEQKTDATLEERLRAAEKQIAETAAQEEAWRAAGSPVPNADEMSFEQAFAQVGRGMDAAIAQLDQNVASLDERVSALEEGGGDGPTPPQPPAKRYPTGPDDPDVGIRPGVTLTNAGSVTITQSGKYSGKRYNRVTVNADDVEICDCEINADYWGIMNSNARKNLNVHHCNLIGQGTKGSSSGSNGPGWWHHNKILKFENGLNVWGNGSIIEWNVIDDMQGPSTAHKDCIQADGNIDGLIIRNNYLNNWDGETSAVMLDNCFGPLKNVKVHDNFLGGGGFPGYLDASFTGGAVSGIEYLDNDMKKGGWGYFYKDKLGTQYTKRGNKDWKTGENVDAK